MTYDVYYTSRGSDAVILCICDIAKRNFALSRLTSVIKKGYNKTDDVLLGGRDTQIFCLCTVWTQHGKFIFHTIKTGLF